MQFKMYTEGSTKSPCLPFHLTLTLPTYHKWHRGWLTDWLIPQGRLKRRVKKNCLNDVSMWEFQTFKESSESNFWGILVSTQPFTEGSSMLVLFRISGLNLSEALNSSGLLHLKNICKLAWLFKSSRLEQTSCPDRVGMTQIWESFLFEE